MGARSERPPAGEPASNRCRCGHFPTTHMRVVPITEPGGMGYRLEPTGPCARCGDATCPRFTRAA